MATVANILTDVGYNLNETINALSSEPSEAECISWINQTIDWIVQACSEMGSEIGRSMGTITCAESTITAITAANPGSATDTAHGFSTGDVITIANVVGMTEVNDTEFTITKVDANTYTLGVDTSDYTAYTSGGNGYKAVYDDLASTLYSVAVMGDKDGNNFSGWIQKSTGRNELILVTEAELLDHVPGTTNEPDRFFLDGSNNIVFVPTPDDAYTIKIPYYATSTISATTDTIPFFGIFDSLITESVSTKYLYRTREDANIEWNWFKFVKDRAERIVRQRMRTSVRVF
jgi:hypothetical protein